jgi:hypothetical protein
VATKRDLDELALALPETTKTVSEDGRPTYAVNGKWFAFHRRRRNDAPFDDVFVLRCEAEEKELILADPRGIFFTTPHWNGFPAVLLHLADLTQLKRSELRDLLADAWQTKAPKKLAKQWLAENDS